MKKKPDIIKEKKERVAYTLFYFFIISFLLKTSFGILYGSKSLLVSGIFALLGLFITVAILIRINRTHTVRRTTTYFNPEKLELVILFGTAAIIAISTGALFLSLLHMVFSHTLYPPEIMAAWVAMIVASINLGLMVWVKEQFIAFSEIDTEQINFMLSADFLYTILAGLTVVASRMGAYILDYSCAAFFAFFLIIYSISFSFKAVKGLMDASCDAKTISLIDKSIRKADASVAIKTLRVSKVGHFFEIIAMLEFMGDTPMPKVLVSIKKIKETLRANFPKPHELFVGVTEGQVQ